jgi:S1-C subfamily serine protease
MYPGSRHFLMFFFLLASFVSGFSQSLTSSSISEVAKQHSRSIVQIVTQDRSGRTLVTGSGFIVKPEGVVVTNYHVIQGAHAASIKTADGDIYDGAFVVDADKRKDLAILKIKALNLPVVKLGDSDKIDVGQHVIAIGNPLGLTGSVTDGIISAIRQVEGYKVIQLTAPISPGSSGGPLLNDLGEVIGVTFAGLGGQNLNLAIPINYAKPLIQFGENSKLVSLEEFNSGTSAVPSAIQAIAALPQQPKREEQRMQAQLAELAQLKSKVADMYTNTRVVATHRVWTIGLASPFPEVKMLALELLEEPVGSASDHIRMPALYAIAEIANSTEDVKVKIVALTKLREPLQADQVPIRDAAIDAVNSITRSGDRDQVALAAVRELGAPVQSGNNGVRIPAIHAIVRALDGSSNDSAFNAALDLLVAPLESSAMIGGMEVRMMAIAAVERLGIRAPSSQTKTKAIGLLQSSGGKSAWESESKIRAQEAVSRIQASIQK